MKSAALPFDNRLGLRVHEAARALGVKEATIRAWISSGSIPATMVGGIWLINPDTLQRMLAPPAGWAPPGRFL